MTPASGMSVATGASLEFDGLGEATSSDIWRDIECPPYVDSPTDLLMKKHSLTMDVLSALTAIEMVRSRISSEEDLGEIAAGAKLAIELHESLEKAMVNLTNRMVALTTMPLVA
jgi:hypothetical protein